MSAIDQIVAQYKSKKVPLLPKSVPALGATTAVDKAVLKYVPEADLGSLFKDNSTLGIIKNTILGLPKATGEVAKNIAQGTARNLASTGLTLMGKSELPENDVSNFLYGEGPVKDIGTRIVETEKNIKESPTAKKYGADKYASPLAFIGVLGGTALDLSMFGGGKGVKTLAKDVPESFLKYLAKEGDEAAINSTLRQIGLDEANALSLSQKLAPTNNIDDVKNILVNHTPTTTTPAPHLKFDDTGRPLAYTAKEAAIVNGGKSPLPVLTPKAKIPVAPKTPTIEVPTPTSLTGLSKQALNPLKYVDDDTASIFRTWNADNLVGKELANQTASSVNIADDSMDLIHRYQAGEANAEVKKIFDDLYNEASQRGLKLPYRENYIPQVYKGSYQDTQKALVKYLTDNNVTDEAAQNYINGVKDLPEDVALRLKVTPSFTKERVFPDYKTAMEYGLRPQYEKISDLAAHYRAELEKVVANTKLLETLKKKGLIKPADSEFTPRNYVPVSKEFTGNKSYSASPNVAKIINNMFPNAVPTPYGTLVNKVGEASGIMQNIALSAGLPGSNINFFAIGQLNKELHSGNVKAVMAFLKSNKNSATVKFFKENKDTLLAMARQGIDVSSRVGSFGGENLKDLVRDKEFLKAVGFSIDKVFGEKTFKGFLPMMQVQLFKDLTKSGLTEEMAGEIVKKNFGINTDHFARSQETQDTLKSIFFAPRFREGIINSLTNTGKAGVDFIKNLGGARGKLDPTLKTNRKLLAGMILSYGMYNYINKQINGNYMWENDDNRKFALRVPLPNGQVTYIEFMPSYLAFARNMFQGAISTAKGDFGNATQKFGSVFSMPVKTATEVLGNQDYFGNPIYKDTDTGAKKLGKLGKHVGLSVSHPYIKETINQMDDKKPLYQSIIAALELPAKFTTEDKEKTNKIFDYKEEQDQERADLAVKAEEEYKKLIKTPPAERNAFAAELKKNDEELYNKFVDLVEAKATGLTDNERYIKMLGTKYRAKYIYDEIKKIPVEERNAYATDLRKKKILSKATEEELKLLLTNK